MARKLIMDELERIVGVIIRGYGPEKIILFGSLASGKIREDSDIDLIVVKSTDKDPWDRSKEIDEIVDHNVPIDILVYTPKEIEERLLVNDCFVKEFSEQGKVMYNGQRF